MTTTIAPSLGNGVLETQQGVGTTPGYDAIDDRRLLQGIASEGVLSSGSYAVTQRAAGAAMFVDIAASTGEGARVQGDAVTLQGLYYVAPHSALITEAITAAHATLPRNDLVVLEVKDHQHDASGSNLAQVRVVAGTATSGAAKTDALGVNGTPTLPSSAIALAVVNVPATDTSITDSQIDDRRPGLSKVGSAGKSAIATAGTRTNVAYGALSNGPDVVKGIVLPTDGIIAVLFNATWQESVAGVARAAIHLGTNQVKIGNTTNAGAGTQAAATAAAGITATDTPLSSFGGGLVSAKPRAATADVTTGQIIGTVEDFLSTGSTVEADGAVFSTAPMSAGGPCYIFAAAGTYDISVQFKSASGTLTVKDRRLWVWTMAFG